MNKLRVASLLLLIFTMIGCGEIEVVDAKIIMVVEEDTEWLEENK